MKQRSVTLVEIIVSMVIFSLILLGVTGIFVAGKRHLKRAQYKQEALNLARQKLEELEAKDFNDSSLECSDTGREYSFAGGKYIVRCLYWDTTDNIVDAKEVRVIKEWIEP